MTIDKLLEMPLTTWMSGGPDADIVLSSRIRLARNLDWVPFPSRAEGQQLKLVVAALQESVTDLAHADQHDYVFTQMDQLSEPERNMLVEKHVVSPKLADNPASGALMVRDDTAVSIMINEEDHLRIQCMVPGLDLQQAFAMANQVDDVLEGKHNFAYHEQVGYLTACPTNVGTGLRASVMLHLPGLVLSKQINRIIPAVTQLGLAVRGLYGEGTDANGNIFQLSNQLTMGHSEQEIVDTLHSIAKQVVEQERSARQGLLVAARATFIDRVWRACGTLRNARIMSGEEALTLLSEVRLGIDLGIITGISADIFNELLVSTRPYFLQKIAGRPDCEAAEQDWLRAKLIREKMKEGKEDVH